LFQIKNHNAAWPFLKPVDKNEVPDYYDHIKFPMGKSVNILMRNIGIGL
jgi:Transcription factor involved in chromatin remodeling, contains bromodomain